MTRIHGIRTQFFTSTLRVLFTPKSQYYLLEIILLLLVCTGISPPPFPLDFYAHRVNNNIIYYYVLPLQNEVVSAPGPTLRKYCSIQKINRTLLKIIIEKN